MIVSRRLFAIMVMAVIGLVLAIAVAQPVQEKPRENATQVAENAAIVHRTTLEIPAGKYTGIVIVNGGPPDTISSYVTIIWKGGKYLYVIEPGKSQFLPFVDGWTLKDREARVDLSWTLSKPSVWGVTGTNPVTFPEQ